MIRKNLSESELAAYQCLSDLKLQHLTVPFHITDGVLISSKGTGVSRGALNIPLLYERCLKGMYAYSFHSFSPGIYAFYGSGSMPQTGEQYGDYLKRQMDELQAADRPSSEPEIDMDLHIFLSLFQSGIDRYLDVLNGIQSFSLLHGDLYSGNILLFSGRYALIDFEFLRIGPPCIELAFLLCWDYLSGDLALPKKHEIVYIRNHLVQEHIVTEEECDLIWYVFIPMFATLALFNAKKGTYKNPLPIYRAIHTLAESTVEKSIF